jgi:hypothetical protein
MSAAQMNCRWECKKKIVAFNNVIKTKEEEKKDINKIIHCFAPCADIKI